jgi:hypothetical protein
MSRKRFKGTYLLAMREQAPKMFMELRRSGKLDQHLQEKSTEAHQMLRELLAQKPTDAWESVRVGPALGRGNSPGDTD